MLLWTYIGLHLKYPVILVRFQWNLAFSLHIFEKYFNIKFHENSSSRSRVVPCGQPDRQTDMTKLKYQQLQIRYDCSKYLVLIKQTYVWSCKTHWHDVSYELRQFTHWASSYHAKVSVWEVAVSEQYMYTDGIKEWFSLFYLLPLCCYSIFFPSFITSQARTVSYIQSGSGFLFSPPSNANRSPQVPTPTSGSFRFAKASNLLVTCKTADPIWIFLFLDYAQMNTDKQTFHRYKPACHKSIERDK
jgi:hypothetical protein